MSEPDVKKNLLISIGIALVLLGLVFVARQVPIRSYSGFSVCGIEERYSILNNGANEYLSRVKHFEDYDKKINPTKGGLGASPAIACPENGKIALYLL